MAKTAPTPHDEATMTAKTQAQSPADRLAGAKAAEQAARDALTALRERHMAGDKPVTAQEFGDAGHEVELAELEREGAEAALAEAQRQERLAALAQIDADIEANWQPATAAEAFKRGADALAEVIAAAGPAMQRQVLGWQRRLRDHAVPETPRGEAPSPKDRGLGWRDVGWGGRREYVLRGDRVIRAHDVAALHDAMVVRACKQAGVSPHLLLSYTPSTPAGLAEDPDAWFGSH